MANKIKVVGYAKKEVFGNGIEYRNFSPDLVGNQFGAAEGTPIFTSGSFNISTNIEGKIDKTFVTNEFSNFSSLETLNLDSTLESIFTKYSKNAKLNLDYTDALTFAFFGSLREYIRVSLENIIIKWPASLYIREVDNTNPSLTGNTVINYVYNATNNTSTFEIDTARIENNFNINFLSGGTIENTFNESNTLRNLVLNYNNYSISTSGGTYSITNLIGASGLTNSSISVTVAGNPFPNYSSYIINYHVKPNDTKVEEFFFNLNEFENNLLNRLTIPEYTSNFKVYNESETGDIIETVRKLTWPISDGYNIDFNSISYANFVTQLLEIADINDNSKSNLMVRFLVSTSISEFDSVADINGSYPDSNGQKMTNTLKIYGREFDEVKKYSDGIRFANTVTYDKKNNTPDAVLKNLARVLGWELTTSISQVDVLSNFLSLNNNYYDGHSRGYSDAEAEIELWRRIVLNTPWIWKSKGTRKAIEFLFKFIGAPDGLVAFNEYLYVADNSVDVTLVTEMMEFFNDTSDLSTINIDSDGFPKVFPDTPEMYFQKAGLWYRQTGGPTPDIDILAGNNPHIGPYDGGQAYIDQFRGCLVPNYSASTAEEVNIDAEVNLFTNYGNGTFDECCDADALVVLDTYNDSYFQTALNTNLSKIYDNNPVVGCGVETSWTLKASLTGETFYNEVIYTSSGATTGATTNQLSAITESDYVNALTNFMTTGTTGTILTDATYVYYSGDSTFTIISTGSCESELVDTYFKIDLCLSSAYNCEDVTVSGLIAFNVSLLTTDACEAKEAYPLSNTYYHDGVGTLPTTGDTVYSDINGITSVSHPSPTHVYMGGNFVDVANWLQTDVNGVREEIICPVITCTAEIGATTTLLNGVNYDTFYLRGLTELNSVTFNYRLTNLQLLPNSTANPIIFDSLGHIIPITMGDPSFNITNRIDDSTDVYDYTASINPRGTFDPSIEGYSVEVTVLSLDKDCLTGPQTITFNIGITN
tara:strand:+ start:50634 stop:53600 length:2967 start_codon:yes stop_codon:yes gene_type:complete